jgi:hypothetical protein
LLVVVYGIWLFICEAYQRTGAGSSENYCRRELLPPKSDRTIASSARIPTLAITMRDRDC